MATYVRRLFCGIFQTGADTEVDKKKSMSQKEKDALKAKREKERRAEAKKKNAEKLAKLKAADKARKQKQKEKAKLQRQKKKEQLAKEKAKAERKKTERTIEKQPAEPQIAKAAEKMTPVPKPSKAAKKSDKQIITAAKTSISSAVHFIDEKVIKKLSAFIKKAFSAKYRVISIILIAFILTATGVPTAIFTYRNRLITTVGDGYDYYGITDDREKEIEISAENQLERADELKRHGQKSKFLFFANTEISFDKWYSNGKLIFGNVEQNNCELVITIFDKEGKTVLYRSDGIKPGYYIPEIRLFEQLDDGEYKTRMYVAGYDPDSNELVGVQYVKVKLIVGGE